ncbi:TSUP family transporter [Pigmentiphaga aceris]|uniref:Probable membrane transporter protein n=1 Tax=Pigmentiphaga aceris TaxID=1940612 RepID=A0A5C0B4C2_9BURK|nr:TSUP family transporter [Pigmentiphaga aceris]QEI09588.1 TSUP family transporter [Pigmentiphaga aceris]
MDLSSTQWLMLACAAFMAGYIDSIVGGGGLIQVPAIFSIFPREAPATLLGTSKLAGIIGTGSAAWRYARSTRVPWRTALPAACAAFFCAFWGAWSVTRIPPETVRPILPFVLMAVFVYTLAKKDLGSVHAPKFDGRRELFMALLMGGAIGFYDGLFGPGTGSFLLFMFVRFFGFDFLSGSVSAKIVNVACNAAALLWFGADGHVWWAVGAVMAVFNLAGSQIGSRMALKHGTGFVRRLFLVVVSALIVKSMYDAFFR